LQLQGTAGVLLAPQLDKKVRHPDPQPEQTVHPRVAPGAERDERVFVAAAPLPVVQMQPAAKKVFASAGTAPAAVAPDRGFAVPPEAALRKSLGPVTRAAQAGYLRGRFAAGAKQVPLPGAPESPASAGGWGGGWPGKRGKTARGSHWR